MIIDCHGHYTTSPREHEAWRAAQIAALKDGTSPPPRPVITDEQIRDSIEAVSCAFSGSAALISPSFRHGLRAWVITWPAPTPTRTGRRKATT
jgi:hypothetical protein